MESAEACAAPERHANVELERFRASGNRSSHLIPKFFQTIIGMAEERGSSGPRPAKKEPPPDCSDGGASFTATPIKGVSGGLGSDGVVHLVLNRVRRMLESIDLFVFQLDIGFDLVAREN